MGKDSTKSPSVLMGLVEDPFSKVTKALDLYWAKHIHTVLCAILGNRGLWAAHPQRSYKGRGDSRQGSDPPARSSALPGPFYSLSFEGNVLRVLGLFFFFFKPV